MSTVLEQLSTPTEAQDPINRRILEVSEDQIRGFVRDPIEEIVRRSGVDRRTVTERIRAMLAVGTIRRVRQTLLATNIAHGALVAWKIKDALSAFDFIVKSDPFSGHVVIRNSEFGPTDWPLWTTLKVPTGFSIEKHCDWLQKKIGAEKYRIMPALRAFVLGVGHMRRKGMAVGEKSPLPAEPIQPAIVELSDDDWEVLTVLKRDFRPDEIGEEMWEWRALAAGIPVDLFFAVAESLNQRGVIGRFSTFLEHKRIASFNGLFHWAVPEGREIEAGREIGRFAILTHAYWRDAGPELNNVNIMAVAHGESKGEVMAHKAAIDAHLIDCGIGFTYTNVYWGGRAEIKPSEVSPAEYRAWASRMGLQ